MIPSVRAQDDFYRYVNGSWLIEHRDSGGQADVRCVRQIFDDDAQDELCGDHRGRDQESADAGRRRTRRKSATSTPASWTKAALDALGLKPLDAEFARIDALKDKKEIPAADRALTPDRRRPRRTTAVVHQDNKDSTKYVVDFGQDGLGLPDRDYYLANDAKLKQIRGKYAAARARRCWIWPATRTAAARRQGHPRAGNRAGQGAMDQGRTARSDQGLQQGIVCRSGQARAGLRLEELSDRGRHRRQGRLRDRQPAELHHRPRQDSREDTHCRCWKILFPLASAQQLCAIPEQSISSTSVSRFTAPRCAVCRRTVRAGSVAWHWSKARWAKRSASSTWPSIFPPEAKARMRSAGQESARRVQAEHRHARLDERRRPRKPRRKSSPSSRPRSAIRTSGATIRRWRSRRTISSAMSMRAQRVRVPAQHQQARQAGRSRRVGHDAADHQRLLQPGAQRDRVSRPRSCSRRSSTRRPTMR